MREREKIQHTFNREAQLPRFIVFRDLFSPLPLVPLAAAVAAAAATFNHWKSSSVSKTHFPLLFFNLPSGQSSLTVENERGSTVDRAGRKRSGWRSKSLESFELIWFIVAATWDSRLSSFHPWLGVLVAEEIRRGQGWAGLVRSEPRSVPCRWNLLLISPSHQRGATEYDW